MSSILFFRVATFPFIRLQESPDKEGPIEHLRSMKESNPLVFKSF